MIRSPSDVAAVCRRLLVLAAIATAGVGAWLVSVIAFVLPARDPAHFPLWAAVAACCLAYAGLSWAYLVATSRGPWLDLALLVASIVAIGCGLYGISDMVRRAQSGGDFEGYIVLMGLVLCGHGVAAITCLAAAFKNRRPASAH